MASTRSASAMARSRVSMTSQGLRRSDSEITAKSPPNGAPAPAATACAAVTPGSTLIGPCAYPGSSAASYTADALPRECQVQRVAGPVRLDGVPGCVPLQAFSLRHPVHVWRVADDVVDLRK